MLRQVQLRSTIFRAQAVLRSYVFHAPLAVPFLPMTSAGFILFSLYMIPDPATTPIKPLRQIGSTAQRVSLYKDYTLRVVPGILDIVPHEIQSLTDSFNAMLKEIEDRDSRLSRNSRHRLP